MRWRMRVLVCLLSLIAVVPDILSTIIKVIISFQSESDHWCHSPSQRIVHHRPNNGNVCNNKRYDLIWMLLTEDMRGWILICSQYHMNCYHSCLSFSLQIFSYVSLVACLGETLNQYGLTVQQWYKHLKKFFFHAIFCSNEKILHLSPPVFGFCQPQQT